jgi:thioredoxin 1
VFAIPAMIVDAAMQCPDSMSAQKGDSRMTRIVSRRLLLSLALLCLCIAGFTVAGIAASAQEPVVPVRGMVTLVDLGAGYCPPCRLMEPVLKQAEREYRGRAAVVIIDVTKYASLATSLGVRVIPTQIFYDKTGREVARHEGYLERKALNSQLDKMLAE